MLQRVGVQMKNWLKMGKAFPVQTVRSSRHYQNGWNNQFWEQSSTTKIDPCNITWHFMENPMPWEWWAIHWVSMLSFPLMQSCTDLQIYPNSQIMKQKRRKNGPVSTYTDGTILMWLYPTCSLMKSKYNSLIEKGWQ